MYDGVMDFNNQEIKNTSFKDYTNMVLSDIKKNGTLGSIKVNNTKRRTHRMSVDFPGSVKNSLKQGFGADMF
jgi:hypothetical protein